MRFHLCLRGLAAAALAASLPLVACNEPAEAPDTGVVERHDASSPGEDAGTASADSGWRCTAPQGCPGTDEACRSRTCTDGVCGFQNASEGTACGTQMMCDGQGACVGCLAASDCPGADTECATRSCTTGTCGFRYAAAGTPLAQQDVGDCLVKQCDGNGGTRSVAEDTDLPADGNPCTGDVCRDGVKSNPPVTAGVACGNDQQCDGAGSCVGCLGPSDCPGTDTECRSRTCTAGVCGFTFTAKGTRLAAQKAGDCHEVRCDGAGGTSDEVDDSDLPVDSLPCTRDLCQAGTPSNPPEPASTACGTGLLCDGAGACVACLQPGDCGSDSECQVRTCTAGTCGVSHTASGTALILQTEGDCHTVRCDGSGGTTNAVDDSDLPVDGNPCTRDVCTGGVSSNPPLAAGQGCGTGLVCDATGGCVGCNQPSDCAGTDTECQVRTCSAGTCGVANTAAGTAVAQQVAGDCHTVRCDGSGGTTNAVDDGDLPIDGNPCTNDLCSAGVKSNPAVAAGTACPGGLCDGIGACVACLQPSDCSGSDTECHVRTCNAGSCGVANAPAGKPIAAQVAGDCRRKECDGSGGVADAVDDADRPADDGNQCTDERCVAGVASHPNTSSGTSCTQTGGALCDGAGACVECLAPTTCPGTDTECRSRNCNAGRCGFAYVAEGTALAAQTAGDCKLATCDGAGNTASSSDPSDLPADDGNQCTAEVCSAGIPSHPPRPNGSSCNQNGGTFCDGGGSCISLTPPTVTATTPANGGSALASTPITVTFSTAMNPVTLTAQTTAGGCSGSIQVSLDNFASCIAFASPTPTMTVGGTVATLTPSPRLLANRTYRIRVTTVATSAGGLGLASAYTSATGFTTTSPNLCDGSVVISQVYGGGGGTSSPFKNDFVELHNRGSTAVTVTGWSIQYASATGSSWQTTALTGSIAPGGYYLVQEGGGTSGADLPTPQVIGSIAMSGTAGKVALVDGTAALTVSCPTNVIDMVAFGTTANCGEGGSPTPAPSSTLAVLRNQAGCGDVGMNATDFTSGAPSPRNSATPANVCACTVQNESNTAAEADYCVLQPPASLTLGASSLSGLVYGRLYEAGVTDPAGAASNVRAQVGWGPVNANPQFESAWRWSNATFSAQLGNDDEYQAAFTAPSTPGVYQFGFRFSLDQGVSWTYCDLDGAGWNPTLVFTLDRLGSLTVN